MKIYVQFGFWEFSSTVDIKGIIKWSWAGCNPIFNPDLSALDKMTAVEKKVDCVESLILEVKIVCIKIALIKKPEFRFRKIAKTRTVRNRNDNSSSFHNTTV